MTLVVGRLGCVSMMSEASAEAADSFSWFFFFFYLIRFRPNPLVPFFVCFWFSFEWKKMFILEVLL